MKTKKSCQKCGNGMVKKQWKEWSPSYEGTFLVTLFTCLNCNHQEYTSREITDFLQWILHLLF